MNSDRIIKISKFMSMVLRHKPERIGITLDAQGWADTNALIKGMKRAGHSVSLEDLKLVVNENDKKRFKFNEDYTKIRASQGHSIDVDVELPEIAPPDILYHGTASRNIASIKDTGLKPGGRLYVHLSKDRETAENVGARHGKPVVLTINAAQMHKDGHKFYLSDNNVWMAKSVPADYIRQFRREEKREGNEE